MNIEQIKSIACLTLVTTTKNLWLLHHLHWCQWHKKRTPIFQEYRWLLFLLHWCSLRSTCFNLWLHLSSFQESPDSRSVEPLNWTPLLLSFIVFYILQTKPLCLFGTLVSNVYHFMDKGHFCYLHGSCTYCYSRRICSWDLQTTILRSWIQFAIY